MKTALERDVELAARANIKWRKWVAAADKAHEPYASDASLTRSVALLIEFSAFMREHELHDYCDGEHFGVVRDNGEVLRFRFARKGDPVFRGIEPSSEDS